MTSLPLQTKCCGFCQFMPLTRKGLAPLIPSASPRDPDRVHVAALLPGNRPRAQDDDIPGVVRYRTYEVLKEEVANPQLRWAYLPYSMHMAGPREAIQHMILRKVPPPAPSDVLLPSTDSHACTWHAGAPQDGPPGQLLCLSLCPQYTASNTRQIRCTLA